MFPSFPLLFALASVHSFTFVAATPEPLITPAPQINERAGIAGPPGTPILSLLTYPYSALPPQVYPYPVLRGPQTGYNICNSSTQGPNSECQTLIVNSLVRFLLLSPFVFHPCLIFSIIFVIQSDFCLWGSPVQNGSIGDVEAKVVAYCTNGHGARQIPPGAITGAQVCSLHFSLSLLSL